MFIKLKFLLVFFAALLAADCFANNNVHCATLSGWAAAGCLIGLLRWCCCRFIGEAKRRETAALQLDVDGGRKDAFGVEEQGATVHHVPQLAFHLAFECFAAVNAYGNRAVEVD